jgi:lipopolysaccharide/colanic/teichoic acid biosynthesis glycosyltransferase
MTIGRAAKRVLDVGVAVGGLALALPVMAVVVFAVRLKLGSPVLFCQERVGLNERIFKLYKFRSMRDAQDADGKSLSDEERLTPFGRMLRSTSLDELPELWNILKGDMSLVGPRPLLPEYLPYYSETEKRRHSMRPGLTGLAQVRGRNAVRWPERLALDVEYVEKWSLWLDLRIAWDTLGVVFSRKGVSAEGSPTMTRFDDYVRAKRMKEAGSSDRKRYW